MRQGSHTDIHNGHDCMCIPPGLSGRALNLRSGPLGWRRVSTTTSGEMHSSRGNPDSVRATFIAPVERCGAQPYAHHKRETLCGSFPPVCWHGTCRAASCDCVASSQIVVHLLGAPVQHNSTEKPLGVRTTLVPPPVERFGAQVYAHHQGESFCKSHPPECWHGECRAAS